MDTVEAREGCVCREGEKQTDPKREREMTGKSRAAGLHKWGGGTKLPSSEMERTRSGGDLPVWTCRVGRGAGKAWVFACNAEDYMCDG